MVRANVERLLEEAESLSLEDRERLLDLLKQLPKDPPAQTVDERVAQKLMDKGLVRQVPPKPTPADVARYRAWRPVNIPGKPVSETLIQERR